MEEWRDVVGFKNDYEVSNLGRVRNAKTGYILKPQKNTWGYAHVEMRYKTYTVHRMVANAFLPEIEGCTQINHKDEDKFNNVLSNLERCTPEYNMNYGTGNKRRAEKRSKAVMQIDTNGRVIREFTSAREAHNVFGYCYKHISDCCLGRRNTHAGYHWQFV